VVVFGRTSASGTVSAQFVLVPSNGVFRGFNPAWLPHFKCSFVCLDFLGHQLRNFRPWQQMGTQC
jgi:hypothetical protein